MKKTITVLILLMITFYTSGQDKSSFDISADKLKKTGAGNSVTAASMLGFKNNLIDMTMLPGGYFTLGTTSGSSASTLDDNCQITFGHPYAMTSYPLFSIDGLWYKPDDYFSSSEMKSYQSGDTLIITAEKAQMFSASFSLYFSKSDQTIKLAQTVKNLDSKAHNIGLGLVFDPSLGKNGDGSLLVSGSYLKESKVFQAPDVPSSFTLWEKSTGAKGMSINISFNSAPGTVIAGNWADLYKQQNPVYNNTIPKKLYDLLMKFYWLETSTPAGSEKTAVTTLSLGQPDFSTALFLRWDLPNYIALDNNLMFPQGLTSYLQILRGTGSSSVTNGILNVTMPAEVTTGQAQFSYGSIIPSFQRLDFSPQIVYDTTVADLSIRIFNGETLIDELHRMLMIPATPISDSGLTVAIDTLVTSNDPKPNVRMTFEVTRNDNKAKVANLTAANVFLYENSARIPSFSFEKDTTGGASAADIVFALDVTGSMGGQIDAVKNNIVDFANNLLQSGVDYRLGMITFLDANENTYGFTNNVIQFQSYVGLQYAHGGGDGPENSLQALLSASEFAFRPTAKRIVIWITDADYHEADWATTLKKQQVINALLVKNIVVHAIGSQAYKSAFYDPIILATGGNYYDITGKFKDILTDISRIKSSYKYNVFYFSPSNGQGQNQLKLQIRYAGLGGSVTTYYKTGTIQQNSRYMSFYPNPFNPEITFQVKKGDYRSGRVKIFNMLGQLIKEFNLQGDDLQKIVWNARSDHGAQVSSGFYIAELTLTDNSRNSIVETAKILYLK